jgi:hypothetical protein
MKTLRKRFAGAIAGLMVLTWLAVPRAQAHWDHYSVHVFNIWCYDETGVDAFGDDEVSLTINGSVVWYDSGVNTGDDFLVSFGPHIDPYIQIHEYDFDQDVLLLSSWIVGHAGWWETGDAVVIDGGSGYLLTASIVGFDD